MTQGPKALAAPGAGGADDGEPIGRGRSGVVFRGVGARGRVVARKIFGSDPLTKAVQYVFLGSPNPYVWNEDAVLCAVLRRRILVPLVELWFGSKLRVAPAYDHAWNEGWAAHEIRCEFVEGRHAALHHPLKVRGDAELEDLQENVLQPLQERLLEAGFEGLVWQAGLGNPVATSNFLRETRPPADPGWAWIDLESGIPAVAPLSLRHLLR